MLKRLAKWLQSPKTPVAPDPPVKEQGPLSADLQYNLNELKEAFDYPSSLGLRVRELIIPYVNKEAIILFMDGAADTDTIETHIVEPLLKMTVVPDPTEDIATILIKHILTASIASKIATIQTAIHDILTGNTIVLLEGAPHALSVDTAGFKARPVSEPKVENSIKGPKESFVELMSVNRSLIRKQIKDNHLMCDMLTIGERAVKQVSVMYLKNVADVELVKKVKERVTQIKSDSVLTLSILEQHIEERPYSLFPSVFVTERPDVACFYLMEGHIVLLMENSPMCLIVPVTFWTLFHTGEDNYLRWIDGNFIRLVRLISLFVALFTPSVYIAIVNFHVEMLPTDLMLAIAATRERVPFSTFIEVLFMEIIFEVLRESGVRIPSVIGPTIGIVGALILGQAAVDANIVSPILVVIVAITGLASFTIPDLGFNFAVRILRFFILFAAAFIGFFGIALAFSLLIAYMVSIKSFEVPFLSPMAPHMRSSKDLLWRPPAWKQWLRPFNISPQDKVRQKKPEGN